MNQRNLLEVDWTRIPAPVDDGSADHLVGMSIPPVSLLATDDTMVTLSALAGRTVVFAYPRTGEPGFARLGFGGVRVLFPASAQQLKILAPLSEKKPRSPTGS